MESCSEAHLKAFSFKYQDAMPPNAQKSRRRDGGDKHGIFQLYRICMFLYTVVMKQELLWTHGR